MAVASTPAAARGSGQAVALPSQLGMYRHVAATGGHVPAAEIDFGVLFDAAPSPYLVLDPDLVIRFANRACLRLTGRARDELIGQPLFSAFPETPGNEYEAGAIRSSLRRVLTTGQPDTLVLLHFGSPAAGRPGESGESGEQWWSPTYTPVPGPGGTVAWIIAQLDDVTAFIRSQDPAGPGLPGSAREVRMGAELHARAQELHRLNEELRQAHARERQVAITLQEAMLDCPDLARHQNIAVRYLPATGSLNACGDWYDVVDLPHGRVALAVGDVVGHGLQAAAAMGMLRSASGAAIRATPSPVRALEVLGIYARALEGALATTVVEVLIDPLSRQVIYSNAGHPPPVLLHPDGGSELLDQALDTPLGVRELYLPRPQASAGYQPGDTLVLYTDGLIERRGEDIGTGLARLTRALAEFGTTGNEELADALLARLEVSGGTRDDIALVVIRL